jgi:hypothetical protein
MDKIRIIPHLPAATHEKREQDRLKLHAQLLALAKNKFAHSVKFLRVVLVVIDNWMLIDLLIIYGKFSGKFASFVGPADGQVALGRLNRD